MKLYQQALIAAQKALDLNPEKPAQINALYNKILVLMSLHEYERAKETLSKLLEIAPKHSEAQKIRDILPN